MNPVTQRIIAALRLEGPLGTSALSARLGISPSTIQRGLRQIPERLSIGEARATRHALRRTINGVDTPIAIAKVRAQGLTHVGELTPIWPHGFVFTNPKGHTIYDDFPWFMNDLRPAGYLGRQIPRRIVGFPEKINNWSTDTVLRYLVEHGTDGVGELVLGDQAIAKVAASRTPDAIAAGDRETRFVRMANDSMQHGPVGSSAAGEQAKFTANVEGRAVLVKFSPKLDGGLGARRWADLLVAEHLSAQTLLEHDIAAGTTDIIVAGQRTFLQCNRFDRVRTADGMDRLGQVMLTAVDAEYVGMGEGWDTVMIALCTQGLVSEADVRRTQLLTCFGRWIANTDMHLGNLSLRLDVDRLVGLTPSYDMLPMMYAPVSGEVMERRFQPKLDTADGKLARQALQMAQRFWQRVQEDERISVGFRQIAKENAGQLEALAVAVQRLP